MHRAIFQTALNTQRAEEQYAENPQLLETSKVKIQEEFGKILQANFDSNQILAIKNLISVNTE